MREVYGAPQTGAIDAFPAASGIQPTERAETLRYVPAPEP
jgi:hypothetical protein